jgi:hypothetical protein
MKRVIIELWRAALAKAGVGFTDLAPATISLSSNRTRAVARCGATNARPSKFGNLKTKRETPVPSRERAMPCEGGCTDTFGNGVV